MFIDDRFSKPVVFYRGKNAVNKFIATILNEYRCCRAVIKQFDKNRVLTVDDEKSNKCWICGGLFAVGDNKVRDHDHMTSRDRAFCA